MSEREMLELAALAAGYKVKWDDHFDWLEFTDDKFGCVWDPRTNDGDSFRLAVKLFISIKHPNPADLGGGYVTATLCKHRNRYRFLKEHWFTVEFDDDPYAATRLAILRAAAEIGKTMKAGA